MWELALYPDREGINGSSLYVGELFTQTGRGSMALAVCGS